MKLTLKLVGCLALTVLLGCNKEQVKSPTVLKAGSAVCDQQELVELGELYNSFTPWDKLSPKKQAEFKRRNRNQALSVVATALLIAGSPEYANLTVTPAIRKQVERGCVAQFGVRGSFAKFRGELPRKELQRALDHLVEHKCLSEAALRKFAGESLKVSGQQVAEMWRRTVEFNKSIDVTNSLRRAEAERLRQRVLAGEDFGKIADECSEEPRRGEGGDWGVIPLSLLGYDHPEIAQTVAELKDGEISKVLDSVDGYEFFKMIKREPPPAEGEEQLYHIARILIRPYNRFSAQNEDDVRRELEHRARQAAIKRMMTALVALGGVEVVASEGVFTPEDLAFLKLYQKSEEKKDATH